MLSLILYFIFWCIVGIVGKVLFLVCYSGIIDGITAADWLLVVVHGMKLDMAIAGYLTLPAVLMYIGGLWTRPSRRPTPDGILWRAYTFTVSLLTSVALTANLVLYGYWGFPLDNTPLLYLKTSPKDAMASAPAWQAVLAVAAVAVMTWLIYRGAVGMSAPRQRRRFRPSPRPMSVINDAARNSTKRKAVLSGVAVLSGGLLIIPIRGGLSTGTNHTGSVYFSTNTRLNHAAVNPIFCFLESVSHQQDIGSMYRFMDGEEAESLFAPLTHTAPTAPSDTILRPGTSRPDVVIIILESFSTYIMQGGEGGLKGVTPHLDAIKRGGVSFSRFYANSFRTDRALLSILSALPAQPTMSLMDMPGKSTRLPSIASSLSREGYETTFFYGGDADYSNMRSYLMGTGFQRVVSDTDFDRSQRTGKWGVPDSPLFARAAAEKSKAGSATPRHEGTEGGQRRPLLHVILSGSSHEPFDVPHKSRFTEPQLNAFNYTDMALGEYVGRLKAAGEWQNTLLVILPDHLGAWPHDIDNNKLWRYHLPLIMTGGAVMKPRTIATVGCQTDLAATLLSMLGMRHDEFLFSRDMLSSSVPHSAFFTMPDGMGMVTPHGYIIHDNHAQRNVAAEGDTTNLERTAKAYLQRLYDYINALTP